MSQVTDDVIYNIKVIRLFKKYIDNLLTLLVQEKHNFDIALGISKSDRASFNADWAHKNKHYHTDQARAVEFINYYSELLNAEHEKIIDDDVNQLEFNTDFIPDVKAILDNFYLQQRAVFQRSSTTQRSPEGPSFQTSTPAVPPKPQSRFRAPDVSIIHPPEAESNPLDLPTSSTAAAATAAAATSDNTPLTTQLTRSDSATTSLRALLNVPPQEDSDEEDDDSVFSETDPTANRTVLQTTPETPATTADTTGYVSQSQSQIAPSIDSSSQIVTASAPPATLSTTTFTTSASRSVTFADPPSLHIPEGRPRDFFVQSRQRRRKRSQSEVSLIDYSQSEDALALLGLPSRPRKRSNSLSRPLPDPISNLIDFQLMDIMPPNNPNNPNNGANASIPQQPAVSFPNVSGTAHGQAPQVPIHQGTIISFQPPPFSITYDGKTDVKEFLRRFNNYFNSIGMTEEAKLQQLFLHTSGPAYKALRICSDHATHQFTWADAEARLLKFFKSTSTQEEIARRLQQRKFTPPERIEDYYWDVLSMCERLKVSQADMVSNLIKGLPATLGQVIWSHKPKDTDEFYDLMIHTMKYDSLMGKSATAFTTEDINKLTEEIVCQMQKMGFKQKKYKNKQGQAHGPPHSQMERGLRMQINREGSYTLSGAGSHGNQHHGRRRPESYTHSGAGSHGNQHHGRRRPGSHREPFHRGQGRGRGNWNSQPQQSQYRPRYFNNNNYGYMQPQQYFNNNQRTQRGTYFQPPYGNPGQRGNYGNYSGHSFRPQSHHVGNFYEEDLDMQPPFQQPLQPTQGNFPW